MLQLEVIWLHHNILAAKYREKWKIIGLVIRNYWWPGITINIGRYIEGCDLCQIINNLTKVPAGKLIANKVPGKL